MNEENVNGRAETEVDRWKAFVTQVDWSGEVMQESWYGHRNPCRRLALWVHFSSFIGCLTMTVHGFSNWPILRPYLSVEELTDIQNSHEACLESICSSLEDISFTCEMNDDASVIVVGDPLPTQRVPLPDICHAAIEKTFGKDAEEQLLATNKNIDSTKAVHRDSSHRLDLLHFGDFANDTTNIPLFKIHPGDCLAQEMLLEHLVFGDMFWGPASMSFMVDLVDSFSMNAGDQETVHLRSYVCPHSMSRLLQEEVLPQSQQLYRFFLTWRRSASVALMYFGHMTFFSAECATNIFFLLVPAMILCVMVPRNHIRGRKISFVSIMATLMILTSLTDEGTASTSETIRTGLLIVSALSFDNTKAATEWCFLYFLSYMEVGSIPINFLNDWLSPFDTSQKMLPWVETILSILIPGDGLWKLVSVYVLYMAFPTVKA